MHLKGALLFFSIRHLSMILGFFLVISITGCLSCHTEKKNIKHESEYRFEATLHKPTDSRKIFTTFVVFICNMSEINTSLVKIKGNKTFKSQMSSNTMVQKGHQDHYVILCKGEKTDKEIRTEPIQSKVTYSYYCFALI